MNSDNNCSVILLHKCVFKISSTIPPFWSVNEIRSSSISDQCLGPLYIACVYISHSSCMSVIYQQHKDEDGFVYMAYSGENSMGWPAPMIVTNSFVALHENTNTDTIIVLLCSLLFSIVQKLHVCTCIHFYLTQCPSCSLMCTSNWLYLCMYIMRTTVHVIEHVVYWFQDYPLNCHMLGTLPDNTDKLLYIQWNLSSTDTP